MKKKSLGCVGLALILALGCFAGCGGKTETPPDDSPGNPGTPPAANYTVTFDVGEEARAGGVKTPAPQTIKSGSTAVKPTLEYEETSTWWKDYTLVSWNNGGAEWMFATDKVTADVTLTASWRSNSTEDVAEKYEEALNWGEARHLYVHYLRASHDSKENGITNTAYEAETHSYDEPIESSVYGDWGLWVWEFNPVPSEGRTFYPMKIDESGAVYDIYLDGEWSDGGWDSATRTHKNSTVTYKTTNYIGVQLFSEESRKYGTGFWVNDSGDITFPLDKAKREKGDYHWFIRQNEGQSGTPKYESYVIFDPYEGLEPGSAISTYDVVSNQGNTDVYAQQDVAEGWDEDYVGYQIFMASFADSDGDGMGDIQGIISKLDYLEELGVDVLWLTPFQQSNSYHGYDIQDYFTVDPRFGTLADYRELLTKAHGRGMKVLLDFVLNHTSTSNPWFIKSSKLEKETVKMPDGSYRTIDYRNFYTWQNEDYVNSLSGLERNQWYKDSNGYYFYSSFGSSMPELNFDYQATRDAILDVALYWMSFGLDGFRLDAVKHIYMQNENPNHSDYIIKDISDGSFVGSTAGDYSYDVNKDVHFLLEFNAKLKASYPSALLLGENLDGDPIHLAQLYPGLDSEFNFNWYYDTTGALGSIARPGMVTSANASEPTTDYGRDHLIMQYNSKIMNQYTAAQFDFSLYRDDYIDGIFTSNHDVQRARERLLAYWNENGTKPDWAEGKAATEEEAELSGKLLKIYLGMSLLMPGITWIYQGDEIGMFGSKTANPTEEGTGHEDRWLRQPMKWTNDEVPEKGKQFGIGDGKEGTCSYSIGFNNYNMVWDSNNKNNDYVPGLEQQKDAKGSIYETVKGLIGLRKSSPAFRSGKFTNRTLSYSSPQSEGGSWRGSMVICYDISYGDDVYRIFVNASQSEQLIGNFVLSKAQTAAQNGTATGLEVPTGEPVFTTGGKISADKKIPALTLAVYKIK